MRTILRSTRRPLVVLAAAFAMAPVIAPTPAHADFDKTYCRASWHGTWGYCSDNNAHSWDYNRVSTDSSAPLCQRLLTAAGNVRSGGGCLTFYTTLWSHQYSGGTPMTYAQCGFSLNAYRWIDCLASTP